eukprot:1531145-Pyramimonas_sp.AAC.1
MTAVYSNRLVKSHNGPIRCRKCRYILTTDQSDAGNVGIFSRWTNQMQEMQVYSHDGPIIYRKYILTLEFACTSQLKFACVGSQVGGWSSHGVDSAVYSNKMMCVVKERLGANGGNGSLVGARDMLSALAHAHQTTEDL